MILDKGNVQFGCDVEDNKKTGEKSYTPTITITSGDRTIEFTADVFCKSEEDARSLVRAIYEILTGPKSHTEVHPKITRDALKNEMMN